MLERSMRAPAATLILVLVLSAAGPARAGLEIEAFAGSAWNLEDRPPEVQRFSISHGFNILSVARVWNRGWGRLYIGSGVILAHVENEVRGLALDETGGIAGGGYYLTGPAVTLGLGKRMFE